MKKGFLITFEGAEGSGKSTHIRAAAAYLKKRGKKVLLLREPGSTLISEKIREILLSRQHGKMAPHTELLLYLAARAQLVSEKIIPAMNRGWVVICDRFEDSTLAYQSFGRGLSARDILNVSRILVRGTLRPNLTFILDIDPVAGLSRGGRHDRIEHESIKFHEKVRQGFLTIAKRDKKRCCVIDSSGQPEAVWPDIEKRLRRVL